MARRKLETEQKESQLSASRGRTAAGIKDPIERRKFIGQQGEDKNMSFEELSAQNQREMGKQAAESSGLERKDPGTGLMRSYAKGGVVESDGPAYLHAGETVIARPAKSGWYETDESGNVIFKESE